MPNAYWRPVLPSLLGQLARRQGEPAAAWGYVGRVLPNGPETDPGTADFYYATVMQTLAAHLALDGGDREDARAWIEAHDRWLAWNGAVLGCAEGQLLRARYHRQAGDAVQATEYVERALIAATDPRQPLALLAAHRCTGELHADAGRYDEAEAHLRESLALATACDAPYERALTLLAMVSLRAAADQRERAQTLLKEVRAICTPLGAMPTLARADALAKRLTDAAQRRTGPDGLTPRETEVLRLIASGRSNQEIAADLSMSVRTVERHVTNIYGKVRARTRAEATAYAFRHELA